MNYEKIIHEGLNDCASKEKRDALIEAMISFSLQMKAHIESGDPARKEEALRKTQEIKDILTDRRNALCERTGLTPEELDVVSKHPMFGQEHEAVAEARKKLGRTLSAKSTKKRLCKNDRYKA